MRKILAMMAVVNLAVPGWAGETSGAAFLRINPSVRGEALGGANPAAGEGAQAVGVNPGNAGALASRYEFSSGFAAMMGDSSYGTAALAMKRNKGALAFSTTYLQSGSLQGRDVNGSVTRDFSARDMAAGVTGATTLGGIRLGVTAKAVQQEIGGSKSSTALAWDLGAGIKTGKIDWGLSALNLGGKVEFAGKTSDLPAAYSLGAAAPLGGGMTGLAGVSAGSGETTANLGVEYSLKNVSLRFGYRSTGGENLARNSQKSGEQALGGLTGGIGLALKNMRLDYAVSQTAVEYGMGHRVAVTFKWGDVDGGVK